jgi:hypothetical protein
LQARVKILKRGFSMGKIVALGGGVFENGEVLPIIEKIYEVSAKNNPMVLYLPTAGFDDMSDAETVVKYFTDTYVSHAWWKD